MRIHCLIKKVFDFWAKNKLFTERCILVFFMLGAAHLTIIYADESTVVHGDSSQLPKLDPSKTFETKSFGGFDRTFKTKSLEVQAVRLPTYSGDLKSLPFTEWQTPAKDFYTKSLSFPDFEAKSASEKWSQQISLKGEPALRKADSHLDGKQADLPSSSLEKKDLESPKNIGGEELKQLINRGAQGTGAQGTTVEVIPVKIGRGLGKTQQDEKAKETPETKSLPKSESSK